MLEIFTHFCLAMPYDEIHFLTNLISTFLLYPPVKKLILTNNYISKNVEPKDRHVTTRMFIVQNISAK